MWITRSSTSSSYSCKPIAQRRVAGGHTSDSGSNSLGTAGSRRGGLASLRGSGKRCTVRKLQPGTPVLNTLSSRAGFALEVPQLHGSSPLRCSAIRVGAALAAKRLAVASNPNQKQSFAAEAAPACAWAESAQVRPRAYPNAGRVSGYRQSYAPNFCSPSTGSPRACTVSAPMAVASLRARDSSSSRTLRSLRS
jgi:hypothetical protein